MQFPVEVSTGKPVPESRLKPGCTFPMNHQRKIHPRICLKSGTQFPVEASSGNRVPESALKVGRAFRTGYQPETASHSRHEFRDTLSANKEGHITWPSTYICCGCPTTSRAPTARPPLGQTFQLWVGSDPLLDLGRTRRQVGVGLVGLGLEVLGVDVLAVAEHLVVLHLGVILARLGGSGGNGVIAGDVGGERPA